jgi:hypothetical protein
VTGQSVEVDLSSNPITAGQSTNVSVDLTGTTFSSPSYVWTTIGSCPDFTDPGDVSSFIYTSTASGTTTTCQFEVSVSDDSGDNGNGTSAALSVNSVTGQTVPVDLSSNPITAGQSTNVSVDLTGTTFSSPSYVWTTIGSCPDFTDPGDVSSFIYTSTASGTTTTCQFEVSVSDDSGDNGNGTSAALTVNSVPVTPPRYNGGGYNNGGGSFTGGGPTFIPAPSNNQTTVTITAPTVVPPVTPTPVPPVPTQQTPSTTTNLGTNESENLPLPQPQVQVPATPLAASLFGLSMNTILWLLLVIVIIALLLLLLFAILSRKACKACKAKNWFWATTCSKCRTPFGSKKPTA